MIGHLDRVLLLAFIGLAFDFIGYVALLLVALFQRRR